MPKPRSRVQLAFVPLHGHAQHRSRLRFVLVLLPNFNHDSGTRLHFYTGTPNFARESGLRLYFDVDMPSLARNCGLPAQLCTPFPLAFVLLHLAPFAHAPPHPGCLLPEGYLKN